jgi:4-hydroxy-3-methylbut-2-enyl diphosphate reductase
MMVILARPRGFCDGVVRAIGTVEDALEIHGAPVYVLHEIVHNRHVVEGLRKRGAVFVESVEGISPGSHLIFSAHGVSDAIVRRARERKLHVVDATCPLVRKVHFRARRYSREGREVIIIGHEGHAEVEGTKGWIEGPWHVVSTDSEVERLVVEDPANVAYVTQTTLSTRNTLRIIGALKSRFPFITGPEVSDICHSTRSRQEAIRRLARLIDLLLVVGSRTSSNSNRLREVGEQSGRRSYLIEDAGDIDPSWFGDVESIGVTAGASTPDVLVQEVVKGLQELGATAVLEMDGRPEAPFTCIGETDPPPSGVDAILRS